MEAQVPEKNNPIEFPTCTNKNEARLVCLNSQCQQYPFFCTNCPNDECEIIHQHGNKLESVSFKEYIKRVLKEKKMSDELEKAVNSYRECLIRLQKDVQEFVKVELEGIDEMKKKAEETVPEDQEVIKKLRNKDYETLKGLELDRVWHNCCSQAQSQEHEKQTIEFIKLKEQQIIEISKSFQSVNQMQMNQESKDPENSSQSNGQQKSTDPNNLNNPNNAPSEAPK